MPSTPGYALVGGSARGAPVRVGAASGRPGSRWSCRRRDDPGRLRTRTARRSRARWSRRCRCGCRKSGHRVPGGGDRIHRRPRQFRLSGLAAGQYFVIARDPASGRPATTAGPCAIRPPTFPVSWWRPRPDRSRSCPAPTARARTSAFASSSRRMSAACCKRLTRACWSAALSS